MTNGSEIRILSNITELPFMSPSMRDAQRFAVDESYRYDDVVVIEQHGVVKFLAHHGVLYRASVVGGR